MTTGPTSLAAQEAISGGAGVITDGKVREGSPTTPEPPEQDQEVGELEESEVAALDAMTDSRIGHGIESTEPESQLEIEE